MFLLQVFDGLMTHQLAGNGLVQESNQLLTSAISGGNFFFLKIVGASFSCVALWYLYRRFRVLALATISTVIVFYGAVIIWNLSIIIRIVTL
ncbi:MAG: DUF5658 family protein [Dehalococcoidales bacterium]|nr:DUF5658 family protein [Dehalococcoidales bacterium]